MEELYGLSVSAELISKGTDAVHNEIHQGPLRALEDVHAIVCFDAVRVKIRDEELVRNQAVYLAIGVGCAGVKDVLGLWIEQTEGDEVLAGCDERAEGSGSSGPTGRGGQQAEGLSGDDRGGLSRGGGANVPRSSSAPFAGVRLLEGTPGAGGGAQADLPGGDGSRGGRGAGRVRGRPWGEKYPAIVRSWRGRWEEITPLFAFSAPIRRAICTTNAIESLNRVVRRAVRTQSPFPNDRPAACLALRNVERNWKRPPPCWHKARVEFAIRFVERFRLLES